MNHGDFLVIGSGIVGLSVVRSLQKKFPKAKIICVDKEERPAFHQTGRNSGVIHSGIYYTPGSLKAKLCQTGQLALMEFCQQNQVTHEICGKIIVATSEDEIPALNKIWDRGIQNGLSGIELINSTEIQKIEPHITGISAIRVPQTGIVDYKGVCQKLRSALESQGVLFFFNEAIQHIAFVSGHQAHWELRGTNHKFSAEFMINCAGVHADTLAKKAGANTQIQIVPFRGEYYSLLPEYRSLIRHLVYPVPDARFPFLGVHFTRMHDGLVECGPNAVLAFGREAYSFWEMNMNELCETLAFSGFRNLAKKHWARGLSEMHRSLSKSAFVRSLQKLAPSITSEMIQPAGAGIRAQALRPDGQLVDDFSFERQTQAVHVLNAPSPAATSGLAIGEYIVDHEVV